MLILTTYSKAGVYQIRLGSTNSTSSSSSTTSSETVVTYEVVITADNPDLKLKPRLTANVTIYTDTRENVLTVPNKALRFTPEKTLAKGLKIQDCQAQHKYGHSMQQALQHIR